MCHKMQRGNATKKKACVSTLYYISYHEIIRYDVTCRFIPPPHQNLNDKPADT